MFLSASWLKPVEVQSVREQKWRIQISDRENHDGKWRALVSHQMARSARYCKWSKGYHWSHDEEEDTRRPHPGLLRFFFIKFIYFRDWSVDQKPWSATYLSIPNVQEVSIRQAALRVEEEGKGRGGWQSKILWWGAPVPWPPRRGSWWRTRRRKKQYITRRRRIRTWYENFDH